MYAKIHFSQKISLIIFGVVLTIIILEIGLRLAGFIILSIQENRNMISIRQRGEYRIMCIGESTTGSQYPPFLEDILNQSNLGIKFSVIDKGTVSINTTAIMSRLEENLDKYKPQMVIAMMGINDGELFVFHNDPGASDFMLFLKSLRVYKLARLVFLHTLDKAEEIRNLLHQPKKSVYLPKGSNEQVSPVKPRENLLKIPGITPKDNTDYVTLAELYSISNRFAEAEEAFKKAIAVNPQNNIAYGLLIKLYWDHDRFSQAETLFKKTVEENPMNGEAYFWMAVGYRLKGDYASAEKLMKQAAELLSYDSAVTLELSLIYRLKGKYSEIEELFKKAIKQHPKSGHLYGGLASFYGQIGKYESADDYYGKANKIRVHYYNPQTRDNYLKLKSVLEKRGIKLVCMEYPVRNVEPLKEMFPEREGIVFVDNENVFKNALRKSGYEAIFRDTFGGEFGHCTEKGNRLLADNVARVILKEVFRK